MSQLDINTLTAQSGSVIHLSSHVSGSSISTGSFGRVETGNLTVGGSQGSDGQVLTSTGGGVGWEDAAGGVDGITSTASATAITIGTDGTTDHEANYIVNEQGRQDHVANTMAAPYYRFDGVNDRITIGTGKWTFNDPASFEIWVYPIGSSEMSLFNQNNDGDIYIDGDDKVQFRATATNYIYSNGTVTRNVWNHIVCTQTPSARAIYINGVLQTVTDVSSGHTTAFDGAGATAYIGREADGDHGYMDGQISDVKLYNIALSATEVKEFYSGASVPFKYKGPNTGLGSGETELTSGTLTIGKKYRINDWITNDDFTNIGGTNEDGNEFVATGTTPTTWTNSSKVVPIGAVLEYDGASATPSRWYDKSGNDFHSTNVTGATLENYVESSVDGIVSTAGSATAITIDSSANVRLGGAAAGNENFSWDSVNVLSFGGDWNWGGGAVWAYAQPMFDPHFNVSENVYFNGMYDAYIDTNYASLYRQQQGTHTFKVAPSGTADASLTNSWITAMTIDNTGDVDIATSLGVGTAASSTTGEIRATNDITAYYSSDVRLKKNIKPIDNALLRLDKINGYEFDWKKGRPKNIHSHEGHAIGVSAQEIMEVLPEVVQKRDNGYLAVDYQKIVALLINGIKELKAEIEEIKDGYRK